MAEGELITVKDVKNSGLLLLNKAKGITSRDLVNEVCRALGTKKVGHLGTLDPMAEGLMLVPINDALKVAYLLEGMDKTYHVKALFGIETDTLDLEGNIIRKEDYIFDKDKVLKVLKSFNKTYLQEVPKYSAKKVNGKKLYEYARNNIEVELPKTRVTISDIKLLNLTDKEIEFICHVTSGTYIRSLIRDMGREIGIPITMSYLKRNSQGPYHLVDASSLDNYHLISIYDMLKNKNLVEAGNELINKIKHGQILKDTYGDNPIFIDKDKNVLAIYEKYKDGFIKPRKVLI